MGVMKQGDYEYSPAVEEAVKARMEALISEDHDLPLAVLDMADSFLSDPDHWMKGMAGGTADCKVARLDPGNALLARVCAWGAVNYGKRALMAVRGVNELDQEVEWARGMALDLLDQVLPKSRRKKGLIAYNDAKNTTFKMVKGLFQRAKEERRQELEASARADSEHGTATFPTPSA